MLRLANLKEVANNSEQIDRVNVDDLQDTMKVECMWVQKLSKADEHILLSGEWLNDTIVNASQRLITTSFPLCNGLQDTNLGQTLAFDIQRSPFVQVLHTGYDHWVTISTYGCDLGFVDIYDSLPPAMSSSLQRQIAAIVCLPPTHREINIRYVSLICF